MLLNMEHSLMVQWQPDKLCIQQPVKNVNQNKVSLLQMIEPPAEPARRGLHGTGASWCHRPPVEAAVCRTTARAVVRRWVDGIPGLDGRAEGAPVPPEEPPVHQRRADQLHIALVPAEFQAKGKLHRLPHHLEKFTMTNLVKIDNRLQQFTDSKIGGSKLSLYFF
jgi:hypothetical protein